MEDVKEKADLSNLMEATMMAILKIMLPMVMVSILAKRDSDMKGSGKIMCPTDKEKQPTQTGLDMLANFSIIKRMGKELYIRPAMFIEEIL